MGAPIIGRTNCPECGFAGAHVKKSERCTFRYCPECGAQHHAKTPRQVADLLAKTRLAADPAPPTPTPTPTPTDGDGGPTPTPARVAKAGGVWAGLFPATAGAES